MRKQWIINKGQRSQDGGPPLGGGRALLFEYILGTVYLYIRYRKPITWNSSALPPSPPGGKGGRALLFEYILGTVYLYIKYRKPITWNSSALPPTPPGGGGEGMTIRIHTKYRKPIPWNSSAPPVGGVSPSTSAFPAKIFMVSLSQVWVGLPFCLKDL